jgi:cellulose 1,4-beta-cellobiosidase
MNRRPWALVCVAVLLAGCPKDTTTTTTTTTSSTTSTTSAPVTTTTIPADGTAPSAPASLTASAASCSQINLGWSAATDSGGSGLKGYDVYRNGAFVKQVLVPATTTSDVGLAGSTVYSYVVRAVDNAGNLSGPSPTANANTPACADTTPPSVPTGVTAGANGCAQVDLTWNAATDSGGSGLKGYNVYRDGGFVKLVTAPATSTSDAGLAPSTGHAYSLRAVDNAGNLSAFSATANATTPACAGSASGASCRASARPSTSRWTARPGSPTSRRASSACPS